MSFRKNKILLITYFILLILNSCYTNSYVNKNKVFKNISAKDARELINTKHNNSDFVIIDVRTAREYQSGYIENAINIDFYSERFRDRLKELDRTKTYLLYCKFGSRSEQALNLMKKMGFRRIYNLAPGIMGWKTEGFEIIEENNE